KISGTIQARPEKLVNKNIPTGGVELVIEEFEIISISQAPPIPLNTDGYEINEDSRLQWRYLDLRRNRMKQNILKRNEAILFLRNWLKNKQFVEIETPILTKTTPEGARDFLVPSRLQRGKFYALPQSPQQYKQLLMVAGFERYFQIARCFRDEDPRADRAYGEFTQLDMEMSFVTQEDILHLAEEMFIAMIKEVFPEKHFTQTPWPRLTHKEAKEKYGSDKPDMRKNKDDKDELAFAWVINFPLFTEQSAEDFYHGSGKAKFAPSHHMFTAPHPDDIALLDSNPMSVRGLQHDLALNGFEVGGGSIRIHDPKIQSKIFDLIGFSEEQKKEFLHMLTAFEYGVPPHGGIAPGIDRLLMTLLGEQSVREVIAFPASSGGKTAAIDAPSYAAKSQLDELGIEVKEKKDN
ncbi:MAG: Aspartyl-tRNA synthetase, partial [Parcubacteria group bacterium GW2011_GWC1_41_7]